MRPASPVAAFSSQRARWSPQSLQSPQPEPARRAPPRRPSLPHPHPQQAQPRPHDGVSASQPGSARSVHPPPAAPSRAPVATAHRLRANFVLRPRRSVRTGRWSSLPTRSGAGPPRFGRSDAAVRTLAVAVVGCEAVMRVRRAQRGGSLGCTALVPAGGSRSPASAPPSRCVPPPSGGLILLLVVTQHRGVQSEIQGT